MRETVEEAVKKRLLSDVPLGAFLSGGLDSSIIAAVARRHMPELHTFSVGIEGSRDLEAARRVARPESGAVPLSDGSEVTRGMVG